MLFLNHAYHSDVVEWLIVFFSKCRFNNFIGFCDHPSKYYTKCNIYILNLNARHRTMRWPLHTCVDKSVVLITDIKQWLACNWSEMRNSCCLYQWLPVPIVCFTDLKWNQSQHFMVSICKICKQPFCICNFLCLNWDVICIIIKLT